MKDIRNIETDLDFENKIRPQQLEAFSGQDKIVDNLHVFIQAALMRGEALDHVLLHGPPGLGKTTLANIISNEMGASLKMTSGPVLDKPGDLAGLLKYTKERVQFNKRLSQFQNTQFQLADMRTKTDAAQMLVYRAAAAKDAHDPDLGLYSSMAKLFASENASDVTRRVVQLFGGYGYTREYPVERMMRDAKITEIYEGTSEVQRMVISSHMGVK